MELYLNMFLYFEPYANIFKINLEYSLRKMEIILKAVEDYQMAMYIERLLAKMPVVYNTHMWES